MGIANSNEDVNLNYIRDVVSQVMGEEIWNGFYDMVTAENPRVDMYDDCSTLTVLAEAPGIISPGDVSISVSGNRLNIAGLSRDKYKFNRPGNILKSECLYGPFNRTLELPYMVDEKSIKASYENGMLEIIMQRIDTEHEKTIKVEFKK